MDFSDDSRAEWISLSQQANDRWNVIVALVRDLDLHRTPEWSAVVSRYRVCEGLLPPSVELGRLRERARDARLDFACVAFAAAVHALRRHPRTQASGTRRFAQHRRHRRAA